MVGGFQTRPYGVVTRGGSVAVPAVYSGMAAFRAAKFIA